MTSRPGARFMSLGAALAGAVVAASSSCGPTNASSSTEPSPPSSSAPTSPPDAPDAGPVRTAFGLDARPANPTCKAPPRPPPRGVSVTFKEQYPKAIWTFVPLMILQPPGDGSRWFFAERRGDLRVFDATNPAATSRVAANLPALSGFAIQTQGEGGFLGFAFHPKFRDNGRVYVSWTTTDGPLGYRSRVGYITSPDGGVTFTSYTNLLFFDQPNTNHKAGGIAFGPEGHLYLSFGDGGAGAEANGQKKTGFFSKILRIDVDTPPPVGSTYVIPRDNPFAAAADAEPATFAYGFRNPFRFSIDRETGDIWVGDVGAGRWEEIDIAKPGGNYGWSCVEGLIPYWGPHATYCPLGTTNLVDPLFVQEHIPGVSASRAITGGVVYRGKSIPSMIGSYVYGDFSTKELFALSRDPLTGTPTTTLLNASGPRGGWVHFAEDQDREIFALDLFGGVYKMVPLPTDAGAEPVFPQRLSETGCVRRERPTEPNDGLIAFAPNVELWSDGASKERYLALPDGKVMTALPSGDIDVPPGSVLLKTFALGGKNIETRLLVRHEDGAWAGYSYEWLDDQSDAVLLPASKRKTIGAQPWFFPDRGDCMSCHTEAAGRSLGLELAQLDRDLVYTRTNRISNQRATLEHIGALASSGAVVRALPSIESDAPADAKARAYLHANCSMCHRPGGGTPTDMDLRFDADFASTKTCDVPGVRGDLAVAGARIVVPGEPAQSLLSIRARASGVGRMPPLGSTRVDEVGVGVVDAWIRALQSCP